MPRGVENSVYISAGEIGRAFHGLPINERAKEIYRAQYPIAPHLEKRLFKASYTAQELKGLREDKKKELIFEAGLSPTKERLDRMVMHDLMRDGVVALIEEQEEGSGFDIELRGRLEELDQATPYPLEDYTKEEYDQAVDSGWNERFSMVVETWSNAWERNGFTRHQIRDSQTGFKDAWSRDREYVWRSNLEQVRGRYSTRHI